MEQYIPKSALVAEIEKRRSKNASNKLNLAASFEDNYLLSFIDTLEVKTDEDNYLEKLKSLQHISGDLRQTLKVFGYAPNLYFFDGMWHVGWFSDEETEAIKDFEGNTLEEAIDKAYNWFHSTFCNS